MTTNNAMPQIPAMNISVLQGEFIELTPEHMTYSYGQLCNLIALAEHDLKPYANGQPINILRVATRDYVLSTGSSATLSYWDTWLGQREFIVQMYNGRDNTVSTLYRYSGLQEAYAKLVQAMITLAGVAPVTAPEPPQQTILSDDVQRALIAQMDEYKRGWQAQQRCTPESLLFVARINALERAITAMGYSIAYDDKEQAFYMERTARVYGTSN